MGQRGGENARGRTLACAGSGKSEYVHFGYHASL